MALLAKSDLLFPHYRWTAKPSDNPLLRGEPDESLLNRREDYEVLHFLNQLAEEFGWQRKQTGLLAEFVFVTCYAISRSINSGPHDRAVSIASCSHTLFRKMWRW
jgi:hypothetical protein